MVTGDMPARGPVVLAVDVGASKITAAAVAASGDVVSTVARRDAPVTGVLKVIVQMVAALREDHPQPLAIGVGAAGVVTWPEGRLDFAGNHGNGGLDLRADLAAKTGLPVVADNDANCAAWGASARAGEDGRDLLFLAVGTGLGSGLVTSGRIFRGAGGRGAEFGHVRFGGEETPTAEVRCSCGAVGCLELVASGKALAREGADIVSRHPRGALARLAAGAPGLLDPTLIDREVAAAADAAAAVIDAAAAGDAESEKALSEMGWALGRTVADEILPIFGPSRVVVGGGVTKAGDTLLGPLREACHQVVATRPYLLVPEVVAADPHAVLIGAGLLAHASAVNRELDTPWRRHPTPALARPRTALAAGRRRTVLHVSPHPDDETIGASCTLLALQDAGYHVVNLACSLGRPDQRARRRGELEAAMEVAGFENVVFDGAAGISSGDDLDRSRRTLSRWLQARMDEHQPEIVVGPHPFDGHHGHETVALAISDAIGCRRDANLAWWMWSIWSDLVRPTILSPCSAEHLATSQQMLACYRGEYARNDYRAMLAPARAVNAVRGVEQVFGYGAGLDEDIAHAELLTEVRKVAGHWEIGLPRIRREGEPAVGTTWETAEEWKEVLGTRRSTLRRAATRVKIAKEERRWSALLQPGSGTPRALV